MERAKRVSIAFEWWKGNSVKWSRKSIIFSPFCYRVSYFLVNIFATRELCLSFEPLSLFRKGWLRLKWRPDGILAERLFRDGDPAGPVAPENIPLTSWIELQGRILAPVQFSS